MIGSIQTLEQVYKELQKDRVTVYSIYSYTHPKRTKNKAVNMQLGRIWFNLLLPDNYPGIINEPINKNKLSQIFNVIYEISTAEEGADILTRINQETFKMTSIHPVSFSIDSLIVPQNIRDKKKDLLNENTKPEDFSKHLNTLSNEYLDSKEDSGLQDIVNSGAKPKAGDIGVLMLSKGPIMDIEGNISKPITSALADGYSGEEYYLGASEARRNLYIRAIGTAEPGALARDVTYANSNVKLAENDCRTKKYLNLFVRPDMKNLLIGRYHLNEKTNQLEIITDKDNFVNKMIKLRSPLYCKSKTGICKTCYGTLADKLGTKHIGLIAGGVVNTSGIEGYSMKIRHLSTSVRLSECDFTKDMVNI